MSLSRKEQEELQPIVLETVKDRLGFPEKAVMKAAISCLAQKLDRDETSEQLEALLGQDLAPRFVEDLFIRIEKYRKKVKADAQAKNNQRTKRSMQDVFGDDDEASAEMLDKRKRLKLNRFEALTDDAPLPPTLPETDSLPAMPMNTAEISAMVAVMKKQIEERRKQIDLQIQAGIGTVGATALAREGSSEVSQQYFMNEALEKAKKASELQSRIQEKLSSRPDLLASLKTGAPKDADVAPIIDASTMSKPSAVVLDAEGRAVDSATGRAIQFTKRMPTLKVNIRERKREQLKIEKPTDELKETQYFDPRVKIKGSGQRDKRSFKFHEPGKFQQMAQRLRAKAQLEKLQKQIQSVAKKTGISTAAKLAAVAPQKDVDSIPDIEWWDTVLLPNQNYEDLDRILEENDEKIIGVTNLVEHPIPKEPPAEPKQVPSLPIFLTKKERKKIRTQRRREQEKEKQEKIRLGLMPPPPPKVKISNLMRVLANEAIQDPTKVEAHVRAQMAARQKAHEAANEARKLNPDERKAKKIKKLKEDTSLGVYVAIYRLHDMSNPAKKFKVDKNAQQYFMTGMVVIFKQMSLVVVEGGPKAQKKFQRLMLHRIKWEEDLISTGKKESKKDAGKSEKEKKKNKCLMVWEGINSKRNFSDWSFKQFPSEGLVREHLKKFSVEHYWDLALSQALLEDGTDT